MKTYTITDAGSIVLNLPMTQQIVVDDNDKPNPVFWVPIEDEDNAATGVFENLIMGGCNSLESLLEICSTHFQKEKYNLKPAEMEAKKKIINFIRDVIKHIPGLMIGATKRIPSGGSVRIPNSKL